jgi:hypothetical protein
MWAYNFLRTKHFHGVSSACPHAYSLTSRYGKVRNVLLINEYTSKVVYLSPPVAGKTHDKKAADEADLVYAVNSTLDKDTGFQGYEPAGVLTQQPQKSPEARS